MAVPLEVKESLKRIADIKKAALKDVKVKLEPESPEDMYHYVAGNPEYTSKKWFIFHGKCFEDGSRELRTKYNYVFLQTDRIRKSDPTYSGARCQHCKKQLDVKTFTKLQAEKATKRIARFKAYSAWVKKQLLLGKEVTCKCESIGRPCPNKGRSLQD